MRDGENKFVLQIFPVQELDFFPHVRNHIQQCILQNRLGITFELSLIMDRVIFDNFWF